MNNINKDYLHFISHALAGHGHMYIQGRNDSEVYYFNEFNYRYYDFSIRDDGWIEDFPFLNFRKIDYKQVTGEMDWFLSGNTDLSAAREYGCNYWRPWESKIKSLINSYPTFLKDADKLLAEAFNKDKTNRRMLLSLWPNTNQQQSSIPPCITQVQLVYEPNGRLVLNVYMRSCDLLIGYPHDVASMAYLLLKIRSLLSYSYMYKKLSVKMFIGHPHIYTNNLDQLWESCGTIDFHASINHCDKLRLQSLARFYENELDVNAVYLYDTILRPVI